MGGAALGGTPISGPRRDIGVVFQSPVLFPWRTVLDNVLLPVDVQRLGRAAMRPRALDLLALVGLAPLRVAGDLHVRVAAGQRADAAFEVASWS